MEKLTVFRTALDALQFLCLSELGFNENQLIILDGLYQSVTDQLKDCLHNLVSEKTAKDVS